MNDWIQSMLKKGVSISIPVSWIVAGAKKVKQFFQR
jgi:hypothetical protein